MEATDEYRRHQFADAARRLEGAAESAPTHGKRVAALVFVAASWRDAHELGRAEAADLAALPLAEAARHVPGETALWSHLAALAYRRRAFRSPDPGLIEAYRLLPASRGRMNGLMGEAVHAWRTCAPELARALALEAAHDGAALAVGAFGDLALALAHVLGHPLDGDEFAALWRRCEAAATPGIARQALALLRLASQPAGWIEALAATDEPAEVLTQTEIEALEQLPALDSGLTSPSNGVGPDAARP